MRQLSSKRVVVALRMAGIAGQDKLNGIFEYLSEGHRWNLAIYRTRHEFTAETVRQEIARGASGFIVGIPGADDAHDEIARHSLPVILMNVDPPVLRGRSNVLTVRSDAEAVGHEGAQALLRQGVYKSYGYAGFRTDDDWSRARGEHFRHALEAAGFAVSMFDIAHFAERTDDRPTLLAWLKALPKPCGILAACDDRAFEILETCSEAGIKVPAEVGLLGVNNDPILCENATPRISSIQPDFVREGHLAAQLLDSMMSARRRAAINSLTPYLVGIRQIVHRESTVPISNSGKLVQRAVAYIDRNVCRKLSVDDVAHHLKVSRSLLDLRFRELQRETVHSTILRLRIEAVKRRLRASHATIDEIAAECGWENPNTLKTVFRRTVGVTMRTWRTSGS